MRRLYAAAVLLASSAVGPTGFAQPVFTGSEVFPPEEFAARRGRVVDAIGAAIVAVQGTPERPGEQALRQNNQFFYLTGIVEPRALLLIDGRTKKTTIYLQPADERRQRQIDRTYGGGLVPGAEAAKAAGVDALLPRADFEAAIVQAGRDGRALYKTVRPHGPRRPD